MFSSRARAGATGARAPLVKREMKRKFATRPDYEYHRGARARAPSPRQRNPRQQRCIYVRGKPRERSRETGSPSVVKVNPLTLAKALLKKEKTGGSWCVWNTAGPWDFHSRWSLARWALTALASWVMRWAPEMVQRGLVRGVEWIVTKKHIQIGKSMTGCSFCKAWWVGDLGPRRSVEIVLFFGGLEELLKVLIAADRGLG